MKAVQIQQYGGEEELKLVEIPKPAAGQGQVVVRIVATSFNPIDLKRVSGVMRQIFPLQFPFIPGGDFSGVIDSVGEDVNQFKVGDEVIGYSMAGGAYAEFVAIGADKVALKPKSVSDVEAASLAVVGLTALQMLDRAGVKAGTTVLIHGAGGAVGGVAVQAAHQRGARVIAVAKAESAQRVKGYGADKVIDPKDAFESLEKVDAVLDTIGGEIQQRSYAVLKPGGTLVAASQPPSPEEAQKHNVTASMILTEVSSDKLTALAQMIDAGEIKPFVGPVYPLSEVARGWKQRRTEHVEGKTVFTVGAE